MIDDRRLSVLRAIVEDFVATSEPVGSKALVDRHRLGVSPATIRNDMSALEEDGYIAQPHTSAGRVPTDKGYRMFVDRLSGVKPLSTAERRAIHSFLDGAVDLDDVMSATVRLLAQLTRQVALVQYPSISRSRVRHVELVGLSTTRILLVVIAETGRVEQRTVDLPGPIADVTIADLRAKLNERVVGIPFVEVAEQVATLADSLAAPDRPAARAILATLLETVVERQDERIVLGGTANLTRFGADFPHSVQPVLEALEEQVVLLRLLGETQDPEMISVRIGAENPVDGMQSASVISVGYGPKDRAIATLGILGPTRMDYPGTMGAVRAVARYVGRILFDHDA